MDVDNGVTNVALGGSIDVTHAGGPDNIGAAANTTFGDHGATSIDNSLTYGADDSGVAAVRIGTLLPMPTGI